MHKQMSYSHSPNHILQYRGLINKYSALFTPFLVHGLGTIGEFALLPL